MPFLTVRLETSNSPSNCWIVAWIVDCLQQRIKEKMGYILTILRLREVFPFLSNVSGRNADGRENFSRPRDSLDSRQHRLRFSACHESARVTFALSCCEDCCVTVLKKNFLKHLRAQLVQILSENFEKNSRPS